MLRAVMLETFPWIRVPDLGKVMVLSLLFFESLLRRGATGFVDVVQGVKEARGPAASALGGKMNFDATSQMSHCMHWVNCRAEPRGLNA